jgi:hypothetical protein
MCNGAAIDMTYSNVYYSNEYGGLCSVRSANAKAKQLQINQHSKYTLREKDSKGFTKAFMVQTLKQADVFYLSDFATFEQSLNLENKESFVMSDQDIIKSKVGNIDKYLAAINENEASDDDPNIAYQKQLFDTRAKLKQFCSTRNSTTKTNVDNYELLASVEENSDKINQLKSIVQNIIKYEPDKTNIINQYPILTQN